MSAIISVSNLSAAQAYQPQQTTPQPKPQQTPARQDSVQLSQAAQAALSGDADHDGDSH